jgi:hypothetical protein
MGEENGDRISMFIARHLEDARDHAMDSLDGQSHALCVPSFGRRE